MSWSGFGYSLNRYVVSSPGSNPFGSGVVAVLPEGKADITGYKYSSDTYQRLALIYGMRYLNIS